MADVEASPDQEEPIYDASTNVTNIYYDAGLDGIICYGPNYDFMRTKVRRSMLPELAISRTGFRANGQNGSFVSGNKLRVTAPRIVRDPHPPAPRTIEARVADTRYISAPNTPPATGAPAYEPPQAVNTAPAGGGRMQYPSQFKPAPAPQTYATPANGNPPAPLPQNNPPQNPSTADQQKASDQAAELERQREEEQRAEDERQAEQARQAEDERRAEEQARADAERAAAAQAEADRAAREEAARQTQQPQPQPPTAPASTQPPLPGRPQP